MNWLAQMEARPASSYLTMAEGAQLARCSPHHEDEKHLHQMFGPPIRGEWFAHSLPMWRLIRDLGGGFEWVR